MDSKLECKRLFIYLAVTFVITWAWFFLFVAQGFQWKNEEAMSLVVSLGMLVPLLANLITRWITREGFAMTGRDSLMLGISFKDNKWIVYVLALVMPWIYFEVGFGLKLAVVPQAFDPDYYLKLGVDKELVFFYPLIAMISTAIISFAALGEEGGWRGYMMPKLIKIMGYKKAVLVGGIIWGIWHAPITCVGHNFGTDYPGFPYAGILIMCMMCTLLGIILTFVTEKTGSIWPAAIMHAVNNGTPSIMKFFINADIVEEALPYKLLSWILLLIPIAIIAGICFVITCKYFFKKECIR